MQAASDHPGTRLDKAVTPPLLQPKPTFGIIHISEDAPRPLGERESSNERLMRGHPVVACDERTGAKPGDGYVRAHHVGVGECIAFAHFRETLPRIEELAIWECAF